MDQDSDKEERPFGKVELVGYRYRCRCGHEWLPRDKTQEPRVCPRCKSPNWDRPFKFRRVPRR